MVVKIRTLAIAPSLAALYAALVIGLAPISFLPFQVRVADALIPVSMLLGMPAAYGLAIGCAVANYIGGVAFFGGASIIDVVGGSIANFLACYAGWLLGRRGGAPRRLAATVAQTAIITSIVGTYLWFLIGMPTALDLYGFELPGILATLTGVALGSVISINILGFILEESIRRFFLSNR